MNKAEGQAFNHIMRYLAMVSYSPAIVDEVADKLYNIIKSAYDVNLTSSQFKELVHKQVNTTYRELVKEDPLRPTANLTLADRRAIQYLENVDNLYLGQFISDPAVKKAVVDYIKEAYLENGAAIGNSPKELQAFMNALGEQLDLEKWRVRQIIDTTVAKARVYGQLTGMRQAGVRTFEIAGPDDNLTCEYCKEMLGRRFSLATELTRMDEVINAGAEGMPYVKPFIKGGMSIQDLQDASDDDVQSMGFACPPYHPQCRHRLVAFDFYEDPSEIPYSVEAA